MSPDLETVNWADVPAPAAHSSVVRRRRETMLAELRARASARRRRKLLARRASALGVLALCAGVSVSIFHRSGDAPARFQDAPAPSARGGASPEDAEGSELTAIVFRQVSGTRSVRTISDAELVALLAESGRRYGVVRTPREVLFSLPDGRLVRELPSLREGDGREERRGAGRGTEPPRDRYSAG